MHFSRQRLALGVSVAAAALVVSATAASAADNGSPHPVGAVYTLSNSAAGNAVLAFDRFADGTLAADGAYPTGGLGTGAGLGSQGALAIAGHELYAVNAGSDSISSFRVTPSGLELEATVPSGGDTPISVTVHDHRLFVLNSGGAGNITGFDVSGHQLSPIPGSTRSLGNGSAGPAEVLFAPDGRALVVTEKASSTIDTFTVGGAGVVGEAVVHPSAGGTPFGFDFDQRGQVLVSNASGSASSYALGRDDQLSVISGAVSTNGQAAPCWLIATPSGRYAYTANAGSGTISGFSVAPNGSLTLLDADGITADLGAGSHPLDESVSRDSAFLYNLTDGAHAIEGFSIGHDGSLTPAGVTTGLPVGAAGLVVV